jgi:hypothetical protein
MIEICGVLNSHFNWAFLILSECLSNVLITGESNFDERNLQEMFNGFECILKEILLKKSILYHPKNVKP